MIPISCEIEAISFKFLKNCYFSKFDTSFKIPFRSEVENFHIYQNGSERLKPKFSAETETETETTFFTYF